MFPWYMIPEKRLITEINIHCPRQWWSHIYVPHMVSLDHNNLTRRKRLRFTNMNVLNLKIYIYIYIYTSNLAVPFFCLYSLGLFANIPCAWGRVLNNTLIKTQWLYMQSSKMLWRIMSRHWLHVWQQSCYNYGSYTSFNMNNNISSMKEHMTYLWNL